MTATAEHLEREVKLAVWPGFALPDFDGLPHGIVATPAADQRLEAVYFDTPDLRLARSGITLRHRSGEGWTLKLPDGEPIADGLSRRELTVAAHGRSVPAELARLVTAWVRSSELVAVARLDTHRRNVVLTDAEGTTMGEIVDDEVSVLQDRGVALRFREVEVELCERAPRELLDEVVVHLRAAGAGPGDPIPKVKRALGPQAFEPPDLDAHTHDDGSAASLVLAGLRASVRRLLEHDLGARLGDAEGVHQARVATRRLRSDLRTFGPLLDEGSVSGLREELKWLAAALGGVRDADVLLERLRSDCAQLRDVDTGAATTLLARLEGERSDARGRLLEVLDSRRYAVLLDRLVGGVEVGSIDGGAGGWLLDEARAPATEVLPGLVARPWKRFRKAARRVGPDATDQQLHEVRIRAKRCRYALEAAAPAVGKQARQLAEAVAGVQEVLGDHQDAVVAEGWLRATAQHLGANESLVAGQLVAGRRATAEASRLAWPKAWRRADKRKLRAWLGA